MDGIKLKNMDRMIEIAKQTHNGHLASGLSALPIIEKIYKKFDFEKDVFILSKGHGCLGLYPVLESYGFHPDVTKQHPDIDKENGIYCTTGSLGHGLPVAVGVAMAKKIKKEDGLVYVLMGDGECQEGTTWESLLVVDRFRLNNLYIYIDDNNDQAMEKTLYPAVDWIKKLHCSYTFEKGIKLHIIKSIKGKIGDKIIPHVYQIKEGDFE